LKKQQKQKNVKLVEANLTLRTFDTTVARVRHSSAKSAHRDNGYMRRGKAKKWRGQFVDHKKSAKK
jgi:hypothetical protein